MMLFIIELVVLSVIVYYFLNREFKRLKRQYDFHQLFTFNVKFSFEEFTQRMIGFGTAVKKTSEQLDEYKDAFYDTYSGGIVYLSDNTTIRYIPKE